LKSETSELKSQFELKNTSNTPAFDAVKSISPASTISATLSQDDDLSLRIKVVKMTVIWTACSFSSHILNIMNKYLEGSMFTNNYVEGIAGSLACVFAAKFYAKYGVKSSLIFSFGLCLFGSLVVFMLESGSIHLP
jgi:hypothetical protein